MQLSAIKKNKPVVYYFTNMAVLYVILQNILLFLRLDSPLAGNLPFSCCLIVLAFSSHNHKQQQVQNRIITTALFILFGLTYELSYLAYLNLAIDYASVIFAYALLLSVYLLFELFYMVLHKLENYSSRTLSPMQKSLHQKNSWLLDIDIYAILFMVILLMAIMLIRLNA